MSLARRTKEDVVAEFRREEILDAAHRVFAARSFRDATVDEIADAAGVAKGTVYLYFRSKEDLYWAALHRGLDRLHGATKTALREAATPREKIRAFIETKVRFCEAHREFFRIYFAEFGNICRMPAQKEFERRYLDQVTTLEQALLEAANDGHVRHALVSATAFAIVSLTHNLVTRRMRGWSSATLEEDVASTVDLIWRGVAANPYA